MGENERAARYAGMQHHARHRAGDGAQRRAGRAGRHERSRRASPTSCSATSRPATATPRSSSPGSAGSIRSASSLVTFLLAALLVGGDQIADDDGPARRDRADAARRRSSSSCSAARSLTRYRIVRSAEPEPERRLPRPEASCGQWTSVWSPIAFLTSVLAAAIPAGTAILYACLGELLCERAGVLNLGVEGMMLMGALAASRLTSGPATPGSARSARCGRRGDGLHPRLSDVALHAQSGRQRSRPDALRRRAFGLSRPADRRHADRRRRSTKRRFPARRHPASRSRSCSSKTRSSTSRTCSCRCCGSTSTAPAPGLRLRAIGERPEAADAMGIDVNRLRYLYVIVGGVLGRPRRGGDLARHESGWTENITAGRGWIAVALVIFAGLESGPGRVRRLSLRRRRSRAIPPADAPASASRPFS